MFYGEYQHTIDQKGRISIPAKFRFVVNEEYVDKFYVTKGLDCCLWVFTERQWKSLEDRLKSLPFSDLDTRRFLRVFFAGACDVSCDRQGRILLPGNLIAHAKLKKEVVVAGVQTRFEIWDKAVYSTFQNESLEVYEDLAQKLDLH